MTASSSAGICRMVVLSRGARELPPLPLRFVGRSRRRFHARALIPVSAEPALYPLSWCSNLRGLPVLTATATPHVASCGKHAGCPVTTLGANDAATKAGASKPATPCGLAMDILKAKVYNVN